MRWEDERYVRLYTRNTGTWVAIGWEGRFVLMSLLRIVDRAGVLDLIDGEEADLIANLISAPIEVVKIGLDRLIDRKVITIGSDRLLIPGFLRAQECRTSDKERQRKSREMASIGHTPSHSVTQSHTPSHSVTPSRAVLSRAVPSLDNIADRGAVTDRIKPLKTRLLADFETIVGKKYTWGGSRDTEAIKTLLANAEPEAIHDRWTFELRSSGQDASRTIASIAKKMSKNEPTQPELPGTPTPPPREPSAQEKLYEVFKEGRRMAYLDSSIDFVADDLDKAGNKIGEPNTIFVNNALKPILEACKGSILKVQDLFELFFESPSGANCRPAMFPFRFFVFDSVWKSLLEKLNARDAAEDAEEIATEKAATEAQRAEFAKTNEGADDF